MSTGLFLEANAALKLHAIIKKINGMAVARGPIADLSHEALETLGDADVVEKPNVIVLSRSIAAQGHDRAKMEMYASW